MNEQNVKALDDKGNFSKPYISLKFGRIKSMDFNDNVEAMKLHDSQSDHTKESDIEIIKIYNGNFFNWWEQKWVTKKEAIEYIENYEEINLTTHLKR